MAKSVLKHVDVAEEAVLGTVSDGCPVQLQPHTITQVRFRRCGMGKFLCSWSGSYVSKIYSI